jgi:hypothetical protein
VTTAHHASTHVRGVRFSPDGAWFVTVSAGPSAATEGRNELLLWRASSAAVVERWTLAEPALSVDWSPDGRALLTGTRGAALVWAVPDRYRPR